MDVTKKVLDLMKLALDERTPKGEAERNEQVVAAFGALRLIEKYELLKTNKRVDVANEIVNKIVAMTNPIIVDEIASRAEKIVDSVDRAVGAFRKLTDKFVPPEQGDGGGRGRRRKARRYERG